MRSTVDLGVYLVTDAQAAGSTPLQDLVAAAVGGGVSVVQVRDKTLPAGDLTALCRSLLSVTRRAGAMLIVNDRVDVARAVDADGVHLGNEDLPVAAARRLLGPGKLIGATAASVERARDAEAAGADYLGVGPFRATPTKPGHAAPLGEVGLAEVVRATGLPVVAIGGLTLDDVPAVCRAGAAGVAVVRAICAAEDPGRAAIAFRAALDRATGTGRP